jgi:O-6-methylguanine DNA methyltransferase
MTPSGKELKYAVFNTGAGWLGALASEKGLIALSLPQPSKERAFKRLKLKFDRAVDSGDYFKELIKQLNCYFSGRLASFNQKLDLTQATAFQKKVWRASRLIPYGETRSYLWLAEKMGYPKAVRAVGQALACNPLPIIIPCHRVTKKDGRLGGFSGGLKIKKMLLSLEKTSLKTR